MDKKKKNNYLFKREKSLEPCEVSPVSTCPVGMADEADGAGTSPVLYKKTKCLNA